MTKDNKPLRVLIVEDNPGDLLLLKSYIKRSRIPIETVYAADQLSGVEPILREHDIDVAFLDLTLPDSTGIDSFIALNNLLPHIPIIVLSGLSDTQVAVDAITRGAQDYLIKGEFDEKLLEKSTRYSIERKKIIEKLQESNERYEYVNRATNDVLWEWNYKTNSRLWEQGFVEILGYPKENLKTDTEWLEKYVHPDDLERVKEKIYYHVKNRLEHWEDEFRLRTVNGDYKDVYNRAFILFDSDHRPYRMYGALTDVSEKRKLEKELAQQQLNQQKLLTELTIHVQEEERDQLGKELHDNINQILATVKMYLGFAKNSENKNAELISNCHAYVNDAMEEIRKLSKTLVAPSLGDTNLVGALEKLVEDINMSKTLQVVFLNDVNSEHEINKDLELMLYRVTQEQLNNILKHAAADRATIDIKTDGTKVFLSISDNGKGFDPTQKAEGIGLKNITSRVGFYSGEIEIISEIGKGSMLKINVPLQQEQIKNIFEK